LHGMERRPPLLVYYGLTTHLPLACRLPPLNSRCPCREPLLIPRALFLPNSPTECAFSPQQNETNSANLCRENSTVHSRGEIARVRITIATCLSSSMLNKIHIR